MKVMPYQVMLQNGKIIFAPVDSEKFIKADPDKKEHSQIIKDTLRRIEESTLRFKKGDYVQCKVRPDPPLWLVGEILQTNIPHPVQKHCVIPYQVQLFENKALIFVPSDVEDVCKAATAGDVDKAQKPKELRFKVGSRV
eukprot:UN27676